MVVILQIVDGDFESNVLTVKWLVSIPQDVIIYPYPNQLL